MCNRRHCVEKDEKLVCLQLAVHFGNHSIIHIGRNHLQISDGTKITDKRGQKGEGKLRQERERVELLSVYVSA